MLTNIRDDYGLNEHFDCNLLCNLEEIRYGKPVFRADYFRLRLFDNRFLPADLNVFRHEHLQRLRASRLHSHPVVCRAGRHAGLDDDPVYLLSGLDDDPAVLFGH